MVKQSKLMAGSWVLGAMLLAGPAFADIPPQDQCRAADEGKACDNAVVGTKSDQPGTCQKNTCSRHTPDGQMSYECYTCKPAEGGSGGAGNSGGAGGGGSAGRTGSGGAVSSGGSPAAGTKATDTKSETADDGGCTLVAGAIGGRSGLLAVLATLGLALVQRRRASRSK